ncbi:MAG: hypothetical protein WD607_07905 [Candidatus Paceibacterota bacterium]
MKKLTKISAIFVLALVFTFTLVPVNNVALGQIPDRDATTDTVAIDSLDDIEGILTNILGWLYTIFFIAAAGFILLGAFVYLTAGGNEDNIKKAKNYFLYSIIAIVVALVAFGIDNLVESVLTTTN